MTTDKKLLEFALKTLDVTRKELEEAFEEALAQKRCKHKNIEAYQDYFGWAIVCGNCKNRW